MTSKNYKAMIYFAVATFFFYSKDVVYDENTTVEEFRKNNPELVKRIFDECLSVMEYELSYNQVNTAITAFIQSGLNPQSVHNTEVFKPAKKQNDE